MNEETLFHLALAKPPHERAAFLAQAGAGDAALCRRVELLLRAHDAPVSLLDRPALEPAAESSATLDPQGARSPAAEAATEPGTATSTSDTPPDTAPANRIRYFGDYELLDEIARGGMGVVYKARQVSLNRVVALKMILAGQLAREADVQRFHAEAQTAANLQHPHIVAIHEVGRHEGQHYFSMDYVEGHSLADLVRDAPLPQARAVRYVRIVAEAIQNAHQRGVLHRDLKPSNVLIDSFDQPRVTDFGLAKRIEGEAGLTASGAVLGTPSYMPPEQASANRAEMGPASDVYSLGAVLYELVTGRPPFRAATTLDTLLQVLETEAAAPRLLNAGISRDLETIILKCLAKEPGRRYATAQALADDIRAFEEGRPITARRPGLPERSWRWLRRHRRTVSSMAVAAAVSAVLLVGALAGWQRLQEWRQGRLFLMTEGPVLTAELLTDEGERACPPFTVPTEEPLALPEGHYQLRLRGRGFMEESFQVQVERGREQAFLVGLGEQRLWEPLAVPKSHELVNFGGRTDVVLLSEKGVSRRDGRTGAAVWTVNLGRTDHPALADYRWDWTNSDVPSGRDALDHRPRLVQPAPDLDGDGVPDLVWANRMQAGLLAQSGKDGKVLWSFTVPARSAKWRDGENPHVSRGTVVGTPAVVDVDGDGTPDIIATFAQQEQTDGTTPRWVEAISGRTGRSLWRYKLEPGWFRRPPGTGVPRDSTWYDGAGMSSGSGFGFGMPELYSTNWSRSAPGMAAPYAAQVVRVGGRSVVVLAAGTRLVGLDPRTGKPAWPALDLGFWPVRAPQYADLKGNGHTDVLLCRQAVDPGGKEKDDHLSLIAIALEDRAPLWEATVRAYWARSWYEEPLEWPLLADLDGDGKPEVIVPTGDIVGSRKWSGVAVLSGATGEVRWRRPLVRSGVTGWVQQVNRFIVGPDLDGDGHRDIFAAVLDGEEHPPDKPYGGSRLTFWDKDYNEPVLWIDALSGKDGHSLWWSRQRTAVGAFSSAAVEPLHWWHAGPDGWPQLVVPCLAGEDTPRPTYIVSGGTGRLLHMTADFPDVQTADLDGDGIPELMTFRPTVARAFDRGGKLETVRGRAPELWRRLGGAWQPAADLNGDGVPDLISTPPDTFTEQERRRKLSGFRRVNFPAKPPPTVLSGRTGRVLWQAEGSDGSRRERWGNSRYDGLRPLPPPGDLDGDGVADVLATLTPNSLSSSDEPFPPLVALSGKTGQRLWTADIRARMWHGPQLVEARDLDGDGHPEVLFAAAMTDSGSSADLRYWLWVLSGRDGKVLWRQPLSEQPGTPAGNAPLSHVLVDLDGDGVLDVIIEAGPPDQDGDVRAFSGRDGTPLWQWRPPSQGQRVHYVSRPTLALGDLDGDGTPEVIVLHITTQLDLKGRLWPHADVVILDGKTGRPKGSWRHPIDHGFNDARNGALRIRVTPQVVKLPDGKAAVCVWVYNYDERGQVFLLDAHGKVLQRRGVAFRLREQDRISQRRQPQFSYAPIYSENFRVWCHDLTGDGTDELIMLTDDKLRVWRDGLDRVVWEWPLPDEECTLLHILPASAGRPAVLAVRAGSRIVGLDGATGRPRWACAGPGTPLAVLSGGDDAGAPPRVVYDLGDEVTVCRQALAMTPAGAYQEPGGFQPYMPPTDADPRQTRRLPWVSLPAVPSPLPYTPLPLFGTMLGLSVAVFIVPRFLLRLAVRRRRWLLGLLPLAWLGLVWGWVWLWYVVLGDEFAPWRLGLKIWPAAYLAVMVLVVAVVGLPAVAFLGRALAWTRRRRWGRLALLVLIAGAFALAVALFWLRQDGGLAPGQHYSWQGWYWIGLAGAYAVGLVLVAAVVLQACGRLTRRLWRLRPTTA
jgi:outer membrane protein assembly factor BamB/tRNA A-37 threonylcarbamoyl transferase component Bud32